MKSTGAKGIGVALVYGTSVGLLFVGDALLAARVPAETFGEYTLTRNALPLVLTVALFGVDQALIRCLATAPAPAALRSVLVQRLVRLGLVGVIAGVVVGLLGAHVQSAVVLALSGLAVGCSELVSAALRGQGSYIWSSLLQQGYRLLLAVLLFVVLLSQVTPTLNVVLASLLTACVAVGAAALWRARSSLRGAVDRQARADLNRLAVGFGISMLSFAVLDWLDQVTVTLLSGSLEVTGTYNVHKLWGVYPLLSLASIGGFLLMPELVRRRDALTAESVRRIMLGAMGAVIVLAPCAFLVSNAVLPHVMPVPVDSLLLLVFVATGAVRLFYLLPSALLGAVGADALIRRTSVLGLVPVAAMPALAAVFAIALEVKLAVAVALLVTTVARTAISVVASQKAVVHRLS